MRIVLFLLVLITIINATNWNKILDGNHELRRFGVSTTKGSKFRASYFLIAGSVSGESYTETNATFSWKNIHGEYIISKLPIYKIRVKIDNTITKPYVKFKWRGSFGWGDEIRPYNTAEDVFETNIKYMVIVCKEEDYPINININELN